MMPKRNTNSPAILETVIICSIVAVLVIATVILSRVTGGLFLMGSVALLMFSAVFSIIAVMNRRVSQEDIEKGVLEFSSDHSYRFEDKDAAAIAINGLFDKIQANDEQNRLLIRNISHEVKTPLTGLKVTAEGISDGVFPADAGHMKAILDDVNRIDETLHVMRQYSDIMDDSHPLGTGGDAATALLEAYERAKRVAPENVEVVSLSRPKEGFKTKVNVDSSSLATLFDIVMGNSFDHAKGMTRLEFSISNAQDKETGEEMLKISIADDGCGMDFDMDLARKAFMKGDDVRTLTGRSKASLGLGLSIADKIMDNAGGRMVITSKPGVGTCTTMWFPVED